MPAKSAGVIPYRFREGRAEVLIGHMGGPHWARRERAWSIVKGEYEEPEEPLAAARREFREETGAEIPAEGWLALGEVRQAGGKRVIAWAVQAELDAASLRSGTFEMEWPPRSGRRERFPELDRLQWWPLQEARRLLVAAQAELIDALERRLAGEGAGLSPGAR